MLIFAALPVLVLDRPGVAQDVMKWAFYTSSEWACDVSPLTGNAVSHIVGAIMELTLLAAG
jgi:hypothetical protein